MSSADLGILQVELNGKNIGADETLSATYSAGDELKVVVDVKNYGSVSANSTTLVAYLVTSTSLITLDTNTTKALDAGETDTNESLYITLPADLADGKYNILLLADGEYEIEEPDEINNALRFFVNVEGNGSEETTYSLTPNSSTVNEGEQVTFTISRSGSLQADTVYFSTLLDGTATYNDEDYQLAGGGAPIDVPIRFSSGEDTKTITLDVLTGDGSDAGERFRAIIQDEIAPADTYLDRSSYVTIEEQTSNEQTSYSLTPSSSTVTEGNQLVFTISRSGSMPAETVYFSTLAGGTANYYEQDYQLAGGGKPSNIPVRFEVGEDTKYVTLDILSNDGTDGGENFSAIVQNDANDDLDTFLDQASITIVEPGGDAEPNSTPTAKAFDKQAQPGTIIPLSEIFSFSDPDGINDIVSFAVQDRTSNGGYLTFDGKKQLDNQIFEAPISELAKWEYVVGNNSDQIGFNAIDVQNTFNSSVIATVSSTDVNIGELTAKELFEKTSSIGSGKLTTMAMFAKAAYVDSGNMISELKKTGWKFLNFESGNYSAGDYYINTVDGVILGVASAIAAESGDEKSIVVAFTGSDDIGFDEFYVDVTEWASNFLGVANQLKLFNDLLGSIDFSKYDKIYLTGHSLGASIVQQLILDERLGFKNKPIVDATVFANPGSVIDATDRNQNNFVNISIDNDIVADIGLLGRIIGDSYEIKHQGGEGRIELHDKDWYLAAAGYIDSTGAANKIERMQSNGKRDTQEFETYFREFGANNEKELSLLVMRRIFCLNSNEYTNKVNPVSQLSPYWAVSKHIDNDNSIAELIFNASQNSRQDYELSQTSEGKVLMRDITGSAINIVGSAANLFLASDFSTLKLISGVAGAGFKIGQLFNTDVLNHTVYFEGNIGEDELDGANADRRIVANGGDGKDIIFGGSENDTLVGGAGDDQVGGGAGDDELSGGEGNDTILDAIGSNTVSGGGGDDQVKTLSGANILAGDAGYDNLAGGFQADQIDGGDGNDVIRGDLSNLMGGSDRIEGGKGDDVLMGGIGADVFVFNNNDGSDVIGSFSQSSVTYDAITGYSATVEGSDFKSGIDKIELVGFEAVSAGSVKEYISAGENGAVFSAEGTNITFVGIEASTLSVDDFVFV